MAHQWIRLGEQNPLMGRMAILQVWLRKRLDTLLHTHLALIIVIILSSLDAICVIGQIICDILIMSDKLSKYDALHDRTVPLLFDLLPGYLNGTLHDDYDLEKIVDFLEEEFTKHGTANTTNDVRADSQHRFHEMSFLSMADNGLGVSRAKNEAHAEEVSEHGLLLELTHSFHVGSMVILSILLVETFFKVFAMGKLFLNHKLEIFDAFVIIVSWSLDVAFMEGIWARPDQEGATYLITFLPWRVIRIVNSFVLVIQEKDMVYLKVVKQRLRIALKKDKESSAKIDKYRLEVKHLQGLCRKCGMDENTIIACCPTGRRRRSSIFQSITSLASGALISAMGSSPKLEPEEEVYDVTDKDVKDHKTVCRNDSDESGISVKFEICHEDDTTNDEQANSDETFIYDDENTPKDDNKLPHDAKDGHTQL